MAGNARVGALLALLASPALACDFCSGGASGFVPLQKKIDDSGSVALASIAKVRPGDVLEFRIEKILKGARGIARGERVTITTKTFPHPRFRFVLFGKGADFTGAQVQLANNRVAAFVEDASKLPKPGTRERLAKLVPYLADSDLLVAASARAEFAEAPYADVKALRPLLSADDIALWLKEPSTPVASRGVLGLMLGIAGDRKKHGPLMESLVCNAGWQRKSGYDGLLAGHILIFGPIACDYLLGLIEPTAAKGESKPAIAFLKALRFHAQNEKVLTRESILAAIRALLRYPKVASDALWELKRMKDWDSLDRVLRMYADHPALRPAVIDYLKACPGERAKQALARIPR